MLRFLKKATEILPALLTVGLTLFAVGRFLQVIISLAIAARGSEWRVAANAATAFAAFTGPGLFLWAKLKPKTDNPFLFPVFVLASGIGASMLLLWAAYLLCIYSRPASLVLVSLFFALAACGVIMMFRERTVTRTSVWSSLRTLSFSEFAVLAVSLFFCEGIFEAVAGMPLASWDAVVSWDKWAADIAARTGLGGYISGAYPQGIPLLLSLFYKVLLPVGADPVLSLEHLLAGGLFQVFPLLLSLSLLAAAREYRVNPLIPAGITFGSAALVYAMIKQVGYVDVPLAASVAALLPAIPLLKKRAAGDMWFAAAFATLLFPVVFIKGNGFAVALLALPFLLLRGRGPLRGLAEYGAAVRPLAAVLVLSGLFYLHQWFVGVWTDLGEASPFNHSLAVMSSHRDLIDFSLSHYAKTLGVWAGYYGFVGAHIKYAGIALLALSVLLPVVVRRTRIAGTAIALYVVLWFFTGSYDFRNLLFVLPLIAVALPVALNGLLADRKYIRHAVTAGALLLSLFSIAKTRVPEIATIVFREFKAPNELQMSAEERRGKFLKLSGEEASFFTDSEVARRAVHIVTASEGYRYLGGKGVYPLQENARNEIAPHDIAFSMKRAAKYTPPAPFVPVSNLRPRVGLGDTVYIANPVRVEYKCSMHTSGNGRQVLHVRQLEGHPGIRSGAVVVTFDAEPPADAGLVPAQADMRLDGLFRAFQEGKTLRIMFQTGNPHESLSFYLENAGDAKPVSAEVWY